MKTAAELEVEVARAQTIERFARVVMIVLLGVLIVLRLLPQGVSEDLRPESWSYVDFLQVCAVVKLGLQLTTLLAFVVAAALRWRLVRLGDAIARTQTLARMTAIHPSRARVLGD